MKILKTYICLDNIVCYSYHGVLPQERKVGNSYIINLRMQVDINKAITTDNVNDTVNYAAVYKVISEEMAIPSNLLEHVCGRIVERIFEEFLLVNEIEIKLSKRNPPMGAEVDSASVEMICLRS